MQQVGIKPFMKTPEDPLPWMNNHIDSDSVQVAPQEVELSSYLTNSTDNVIEEDAFDEFDDDFDLDEEECMAAPSSH
jgi:ribonucleoside-diphosphate reductase beta chain